MISFWLVQDRSSHGNILASDVKSSSGKALVAPQVHNAQAVDLPRSQVESTYFWASLVQRIPNLTMSNEHIEHWFIYLPTAPHA